MFVCIKKRHIVFAVGLILVICFSVIVSSFAKSRTEYVFVVPSSKYTVVIDAGHGGIDGGCEGKTTGIYESELNLVYTKILAKMLNNYGISVVMTRSDEKGLYNSDATNLKRSEMKKRQEIIENTKPDLVVSIHMNSYPLKTCRGAQTFYKKGNEIGKKLASDVQSELASQIDYSKKSAKVGDYYILNCNDLPSVLVECGFLSNPQEELLLQDKTYQEKLCYALTCGIIRFLNEK